MTDWAAGYGAGWSVREVDPATWADCGEERGVRSVSVTRDCGPESPLMETGSLVADSGDWRGSRWLRVYMTADGAEDVAVATMLFERRSAVTAKGSAEATFSGRSVLQPAADALLVHVDGRCYAAEGEDGAAYAARLVRANAPAGLPVAVEGSFTLAEDVNFDQGARCLEAAWKVLDAGGWCMQVGGDGTVRIRPLPEEPDLVLGDANAGLLIPGVDDDFSLVDVPNRYTASFDGELFTAANEDPGSEAGFPQRGRWVDADLDDSPVPVNGEDGQAYAERRLAEESAVRRTYRYTREYWPGVTCYSLVRATMAENGVEGDLRVSSQVLTCGAGVTVEESAWNEVTA